MLKFLEFCNYVNSIGVNCKSGQSGSAGGQTNQFSSYFAGKQRNMN